jgi:hypothetical protein
MDFLLGSETEELEVKKKVNEAKQSEKNMIFVDFFIIYLYLYFVYLLLAIITLRLGKYKECCLSLPLH